MVKWIKYTISVTLDAKSEIIFNDSSTRKIVNVKSMTYVGDSVIITTKKEKIIIPVNPFKSIKTGRFD